MRAAGAAPISRACAAIAPAMAVPCGCGFSALAERVVGAGDHALQFGMAEVDAGIDHRDQHLVAGGERVRLVQPQLGERVLRRIAGGRQRARRRHDRRGLGRGVAGRGWWRQARSRPPPLLRGGIDEVRLAGAQVASLPSPRSAVRTGRRLVMRART